jgi:hypothetical protein
MFKVLECALTLARDLAYIWPRCPHPILSVCNSSIIKPPLVEASTEVISAPHITLSYCWGGNDSLKLTASTIEELRSGISISQLPKTIQDAIQVVLHLEIRYIRVDALCILQDSPTDWAKEAASMSDIYRNSFLTIAASGASNSEQGLIAQRDPLICTPCWMFNAGRDDDFYVYPHPPEFSRTQLSRRRRCI